MAATVSVNGRIGDDRDPMVSVFDRMSAGIPKPPTMSSTFGFSSRAASASSARGARADPA